MRTGTPNGPLRLAELDRRLTEEFERLRAAGADPANSFRGLYVDEGEVAGLLAGADERPSVGLDEARLAELADTFGLDALDLEILVAALACDLDPLYERIFAFLQDDMTRK